MTMTTADPVCEGCEGVTGFPPATRFGFCVPCAELACGEGDGDTVGLPVPPGLVTMRDDTRVPWGWSNPVAVDALTRHIRAVDERQAPYDTDPVMAFADSRCPECRRYAGDMGDAELAEHVVVDGWAVIGCEGYVTPMLRAAVVQVPEVLFGRGWHVEARCQRCNETFLPADPGDFEHLVRGEDGQPCGGPGVPIGRWRTSGYDLTDQWPTDWRAMRSGPLRDTLDEVPA